MALKDPNAKAQLAQIIGDLEKIAGALENRARLSAAQKRDGKPETDRLNAVEALRALCKGVREDTTTVK